MQAASGGEDRITGVHTQAMHELEGTAIAHGALELRALNSFLQTKTNRAARNSREHVPHFAFALDSAAWMNLERKRFASIEQLREDRKTRRVTDILAKNFCAMPSPKLVQGFALPTTLPNDTLRVFPID